MQTGFDHKYHRLLKNTLGKVWRIYSLLQTSTNADFPWQIPGFTQSLVDQRESQSDLQNPTNIPFHPPFPSCVLVVNWHYSSFCPGKGGLVIKRPAETKHMASQTKERSQAPQQLSLATHLRRPQGDYPSAVQDDADFSRKSYMCIPASPYPTMLPYLSHQT